MRSQSYSPQHLMLWNVKLPFCTEPVLQHFGFSHQTVQGNYKNQTWLTRAVPLSSRSSFCVFISKRYCTSNSSGTNVHCSIKLCLLAKIIYPVSPAAPCCLTTGLLLCLSWKCDADFASHSYFLVGSALMVNCPWLNQLLPFPSTSFLLVYFIVHFAQCRAHSYSHIFIQFAQFPSWRGSHCQCFQVEGPSDDVGTLPQVLRVPILRSVLQTPKNQGIYCQKI